MKAHSIPLMIAVALLWLVIPGCEREPARVAYSRMVMGTLASVQAYAPGQDTARQAVEAAYARLDDVNRLMSDYVEDSEIGRLNRLASGQTLTVSPETYACLQKALEVAAASGGAFDITCRPLVQLWKEAGRKDRLPDESEIRAARDHVGWQNVKLDAASRAVTLARDGIQVDLGGIAKGYALDLAAQAMRSAGATCGLIDVGGDVLAVGRRPDGQPWRVGVRDPFQPGREIAHVLEVADCAVATSGTQERFAEVGGKRYSHIIDPRTGWPAEQAPSVTVIAPDGATADAWATVFSVLSVAEGRALLESASAGSGNAAGLAGLEVLWIWREDGRVLSDQTAGFASYVVE